MEKVIRSGYTLIEMVVVVGLLGLLVLGIVNLFYTVVRGGGKASVISDVKEQGDFIAVSLERTIRGGKRIVDCQPEILTVQFPDETEKTVSLEEDQFKIGEVSVVGGGFYVEAPENGNVFECEMNNGDRADHARIRFVVVSGNPLQPSENDLRQDYSLNVSLRNY